jgi:hypothetical protein
MAAFQKGLSLTGVCRTWARCTIERWIMRNAYHSCALPLHDKLSEIPVTNRARTKSNLPGPPVQQGNYNSLLDIAKQKTDMENKEQFSMVLEEFIRREKNRRGHVALIRVAMQRMEEFNLEKDLDSYNRLIDVFPRGKFAPRRMIDAFWPRSTPQLELCLEILTKMEENAVIPTDETYTIVEAVFGTHSLPLQKLVRIVELFKMYEDMDPYEIRSELPASPAELSRLTLFRMCGEDSELMEIQARGQEGLHDPKNDDIFRMSHACGTC